MSQPPTKLSRSALALLLCLLNSPTPSIIGNVLFNDFPMVADELVQNGWLIPDGALNHLVEGSDEIAELIWDSDSRAFRYFSVGAGWVQVKSQQVKRYSVKTEVLLAWLSATLEIGTLYRTTCLIEDRFWHLGRTHIGQYRVNIYFVRRLDKPENQRVFLQVLKQESGRVPAIVMSASSRIPALINMPLDVALTPIESLLVRTGMDSRMDESALLAILRGSKSRAESNEGIGLHFSTDYRMVNWNGESYKFTKKQAAVMEALYREGGRAHKDLLQAEANTDEAIHRIMRNKVKGDWVTHPVWNTLLKGEGNGYYYLATD